MHIITVSRFRAFEELHPDSSVPLKRWELIARHAEWASFADLRLDRPDADLVGEWTVFNIGGNKYRLIVAIVYETQMIYIKHILTHSDYSTGRWKG